MNDQRSEPSLLYAAKRLELAIRARLDEMLHECEVTTLQYTALTVLAHQDGISAAQLARDSFVTPQSMGDMLKLLEARHLIHRSPNPASRRELLVYITDEGRALLEKYDDAVAQIERRMADGLSAREVARFREVISGMWERLR